jgi:hypothetical protein
VSRTERPPIAHRADDQAASADPETAAEDLARPAGPPDDSRLAGNFYRGLIVYLDRVRGRGTIRSYSGREIQFEFPFVAVAGAPIGGRFPGLDRLREGDVVGFDVGWTSSGLRVTMIKPAP